MGLIAREIEAQGVPTLCLSSALSITRSVRPPRAVYLDFPLGHTAGKPNDPALQDEILEAALEAFETLDTPGGVVSLPLRWADTDAWKDTVMRPTPGGDGALEDDRSERHAAPQYQCEADRLAAESASAQLRSD